jgi:hypothetical protein
MPESDRSLTWRRRLALSISKLDPGSGGSAFFDLSSAPTRLARDGKLREER